MVLIRQGFDLLRDPQKLEKTFGGHSITISRFLLRGVRCSFVCLFYAQCFVRRVKNHWDFYNNIKNIIIFAMLVGSKATIKRVQRKFICFAELEWFLVINPLTQESILF